MKTFHVRPAAAAAAQRLQRVALDTFEEAFSPALPAAVLEAIFAERFTLARFRGELKDPAFAIFLAEDAEGFQGYGVVQPDPSPLDLDGPSVELGRLYVRAARHGEGVGEALMAACVGEARRRGARWLWLKVWEANPRARAFYRRWGFREAGREEVRVAGVALPHLILVKDLVEPGRG
ncbi:MAG: GNAT family N-acetyltransferase [Holophagaceae bacterium]